MNAMARRKLSTQGRVLAAGLCVGVAGALAGLMAATDDTGSASAGTTGARSGSTSSNGVLAPRDDAGRYDTDGDGRVGDPGDFSGDGRFGGDSSSSGSTSSSGTGTQPSFPQPQTRSGGS